MKTVGQSGLEAERAEGPSEGAYIDHRHDPATFWEEGKNAINVGRTFIDTDRWLAITDGDKKNLFVVLTFKLRHLLPSLLAFSLS